MLPDNEATAENVTAAVQLALAYRDRWLAAWRARLVHRSSSAAKTIVPVAFRWRVGVFARDGGSEEYIDPSPIAETACATLAAVVCHQRAAASNVGGTGAAFEHFAAAGQLIAWLRQDVLPGFCPWLEQAAHNRRREPHFLADTWYAAVAAAIEGQAICKQALLDAVRKQPPGQVAVRSFQGGQQFGRAAALLPAEPQLHAAKHRAAAFAYRHLAETLANDYGSEQMGLAVACATEAVRLFRLANEHGSTAAAGVAQATKKYEDCLAELDRRNDVEAGCQTVPPLSSVRVVFSTTSETITIQHDDDSQTTIVLPLK